MRRITRATLTIVVALALGACSTGSAGGGGSAPTRGGTLRVGVVGLTTFDPAQADDPTAVAVAEMLFAPLVRLDPRTHEPRPEIASRWHGDASQTRFTFALRRSVRFSDGSAITAADVKATLDRVAAKVTKSPLAPLLDKVVGFAETHDAGTVPGLSGVAAPDAHTVEISLTTPMSVFPAVLADPGLGIVKATATAASFDPRPVGSGPFSVEGASGFSFNLRAVKHALRPALVSSIRLSLFAKQADARAAFATKQLDILRPGPDDDVDEGSGVVSRAPYLALGFYAVNLKNPKFADPRFREAIVRGMDAAKLAELGYRGRGKVARGLMPAGVPGGPVDQCTGVCDHDPVASKQLLGEAFPSGKVPSVAIDYDTSATQTALVAEVAAELTAVGIPAVPRPHPAAEYPSFLANGDPEIFRLGWVGDFASTDAFLAPLFVPNAPENVAHVSSPAFETDLAAARKEARPSPQLRSYRDAASSVLATFAVAPVVQFDTRLVASPTVRRLEIDPFGGFDSATLWLRPAVKRG